MLAHDEANPVVQAIAVVNMDGLSYEVYFKKINELVIQLRDSWRQGQRVKALKVAIQLSKLLADSSQPRLYAKKYRMITESLDEFGRLVYNRLHSLARDKSQSSSACGRDEDHDDRGQRRDNETTGELEDSCQELAKDTCRNWFLKVASIRELVPRFYIELAILSACDILFPNSIMTPTNSSFLKEQFFLQTLRRLSKTAWGFGNPIVALHARAYLCRVASRLLDGNGRKHHVPGSLESAPSQLFSELIISNLNCCATQVRRLDVKALMQVAGVSRHHKISSNADTISNSTNRISTDINDLIFELLSSPMATILQMLTSRYEDVRDQFGGTERETDSGGDKIERHLQCCLQELLDNLAVGEHEWCAFRRNVVLNAIFRALPSDPAASRAQRLMYELRVGYDKWKHETKSGGNKLRVQRDDHHRRTSPAGDVCLDEQIVISSFYTALTNLMIALDASEHSGCPIKEEQKEGATELDSNPLLSCAELMLDELIVFHATIHQQPMMDVVDTHYLKCFKAVLSYANHNMNEAAVDRLLRGYLARYGGDKRKRSNLGIQQQQATNLLDIIKTLFTSRTNLAEFERILAPSSFNQLFDYIRKDDHKLEAAKWILESMRANIKLSRNRAHDGQQANQAGSTPIITSHIMINFLLKLFGAVNDALSPLVDQDELEHLGQLVVFYLDLISLDDIHERLEFYSRCRSCVGNIQSVLDYLIRRVLEQPEAHRLVERKRSARRNFLNGCLAFAFSTIPALYDSPGIRLDLYQLGCAIALEQSSLSLADYYLKQIMATLVSFMVDHSNQAASSLDGRSKSQITYPSQKSSPSATERRLSLLLELVLKHQDHIDLKQKMALSELIRSSFPRCSSLLQSLKHLNCIERYDDGDKLNDNNDV